MSNKYSFKNIDVIIEPNSGIVINKINNFKINNLNTEKKFEGIYFASRYRHQYAGLLHDYIGGYLQLKKIYPDLKLIFFKYNQSENNINSLRNELPVLDFIKYFNAEVINIDEESCYFDEILIHNAEVPIIPDIEKIIDYRMPDEFSTETKTWRINSMKCLLEEFEKHIDKNQEKQNIYVTRSLVNKFWMKSTNEYILNKRVQNIIFDEPLDIFLNDNGYKIVEFFNYGFFDQINISYNSNIYLTIDGSTLTNAIWCNDKTKIIKIIINDEYKKMNYYWDEKLASVNKKFFKTIDVSNLNSVDAFNKIQQEILSLYP